MKRKIIIIDDDREGTKEIKESLEKEGFEITCVYNASEGLSSLKNSSFDLVLLDLMLPDGSGFKVAQEIKKDSLYYNTPIIAISLRKESIDKHIAAKVGIIEYLEKPLDMNKLIFRVKDLLNIK